MKITAAVSRANTSTPIIETLELEAPHSGELLVRICAAGICHTDLHAQSGRLSPLPIVLGHEGAGIVETVGDGVQGFAPGDAVVLSGSSCGICPNCSIGLPSYCDQAMPRSFGGQRTNGTTALKTLQGEAIHSHFFGQSSFATHSIVPERTAVKLDVNLPLEIMAPLGCGVITGAGSVIEALRVGAGSTIAIFGVGAVGLSAVMAARLVGAERIVAIDINSARMELAKELGATDTIAAGAEDLAERIRAITGRGMNFSFNTTTSAQVFTAAVDCLAMRGVAGFVAAPRDEWSPPMFKLLSGGRMIRGILGGDAAPRRFIPMLIHYWQQGRFPFDRLIRCYPFADIEQAFADIHAGKTIKPVLRMT